MTDNNNKWIDIVNLHKPVDVPDIPYTKRSNNETNSSSNKYELADLETEGGKIMIIEALTEDLMLLLKKFAYLNKITDKNKYVYCDTI